MAKKVVAIVGSYRRGRVTETALTKRFIERLSVYGYWPWGRPIPRMRRPEKSRNAVLVTSSACPAFLGRFLMRSSLQVLKQAADTLGVRVVSRIYFGSAAQNKSDTLTEKQRQKVFRIGRNLAVR